MWVRVKTPGTLVNTKIAAIAGIPKKYGIKGFDSIDLP
jgi:hypothetical protein